jgi:hypothetical protein
MQKKYVKKPVVIDAVQWTGDNKQEIIDFCGECLFFEYLDSIDMEIPIIKTLEGNMDCKMNSFIIKGVKGEFYPCSDEIFELTYDELLPEPVLENVGYAEMHPEPTTKENLQVQGVAKSLHNTTSNGARKNVKDIQFWGDGDTFALISKASSESEGWFKSTKAMQVDGVGCVVQVTTQQRNPDGSYSIDDAVTFVPNAKIEVALNDNGDVVSRKIVDIKKPVPFK